MGGTLLPQHPPGDGVFGAIAGALGPGIPISSLTSVVCGNKLPRNELQGQSQRKDSKDGGAAFGCPAMLSMASLVLALYFIRRQPITRALMSIYSSESQMLHGLAPFRSSDRSAEALFAQAPRIRMFAIYNQAFQRAYQACRYSSQLIETKQL